MNQKNLKRAIESCFRAILPGCVDPDYGSDEEAMSWPIMEKIGKEWINVTRSLPSSKKISWDERLELDPDWILGIPIMPIRLWIALNLALDRLDERKPAIWAVNAGEFVNKGDEILIFFAPNKPDVKAAVIAPFAGKILSVSPVECGNWPDENGPDKFFDDPDADFLYKSLFTIAPLKGESLDDSVFKAYRKICLFLEERLPKMSANEPLLVTDAIPLPMPVSPCPGLKN